MQPMPRLAHGVLAVFRAPFDPVVRALLSLGYASNVYYEVLSTEPRVAVAVGEKLFIRAGNYLAATTVVVERGASTVVKVVVAGSRVSPLDMLDFGAAKSYARMVVEGVEARLGVKAEVVREVPYLDRSTAKMLWGYG